MMHPSSPPALRNEIYARIQKWIQFELNRQTVHTLTDLGEPRFHIDGRANLDPWGRPQNDGPALRALAAIHYARVLLSDGRFNEVKATLYRSEIPARSLIKRDLEYVAHHWNEASFDLWEEVQGFHFYTLTAQKMAMVHGSALAKTMNDEGAARFYQSQAQQIQNQLSRFGANGRIQVTLPRPAKGLANKTSPDDVAVLLSAIQTFDDQGFHVPTKELHATVLSLMRAFQKNYPINQVTHNPAREKLGVAIGRYPEDIYDGAGFSGGNPWFLATLGLAEYFCRIGWKDQALDQFRRMLYHRGNTNALSEQFDRTNGYQRGARELTWSHTSFITAYRACFK
jgi:glucoamylase